MTDDLGDLQNRPKRYQNIDGTGELSFGLMILAFALTSYLDPIAHRTGILPRGLAGLLLYMYGMLVPFLLLGVFATRAIKKYITYPRTGYVVYRRITPENARRTIIFWIAVFLAAAGVAAVAALIQRYHDNGWTRAAMIAGFLGPYMVLAHQARREHPWKLAVIAALAAGLLAISTLVPGSTVEVSRPMMLFTSATWIVSSGITLWLYICHTSPPAPEDE
jgi:hypothetical protein